MDSVTPRALLTPTASRARARAADPAARARPGSGAQESGAPGGQGGKAERGADLSASWPPRDRASLENLGPRPPLGLEPRAPETASRGQAGRRAQRGAGGQGVGRDGRTRSATAGRGARQGRGMERGAVTGRQGAGHNGACVLRWGVASRKEAGHGVGRRGRRRAGGVDARRDDGDGVRVTG